MARNEKQSTEGVSRRDFLKLAAVTAAGAVAGFSPGTARAGEERPGSAYTSHRPGSPGATDRKIKIQPPKEKPRYDILDAHLHFTDFLQNSDGFPALCDAMDMSGVPAAVIFGMGMAKQWDDTMDEPPHYYLSNDSRCYYYSATDFLVAEELLAQPPEIRERFYPFCCGFNGNDRFAADHVEQVLRLYPKFWQGIGEIMSRHDDLTALTYGEAPHMDSPGFQGIYDLAATRGLPVLVHHNVTAQNTERILYLDELKRALAYNRNCNIIWAHVGISRRVEIKGLTTIADDLLRENKNLWVDISWVVYDYYFLDHFPTNYYDGNNLDDWVTLIERYPDRFLIGTDKVGHWETYPAEVVKYYTLLDKLRPATVDMICQENALSLIKTYD
ncbi:MAG: amidohydrolase family protein [Schwartzia sp.]|nr:amidohydrolase family protein [Schwartzia sp. (in: firmicutes)]